MEWLGGIVLLFTVVTGDMHLKHVQKQYKKIAVEAVNKPTLCNKLPISAGSGFDFSWQARKTCYEDVFKNKIFVSKAVNNPELCNQIPVSVSKSRLGSFQPRNACYEAIIKESPTADICEKIENALLMQKGKEKYETDLKYCKDAVVVSQVCSIKSYELKDLKYNPYNYFIDENKNVIGINCSGDKEHKVLVNYNDCFKLDNLARSNCSEYFQRSWKKKSLPSK